MNLFEFSKLQSGLLKSAGRERTGCAYLSAFRSFSRFLGRNAEWDDICADTIKEYENWLAGNGLAPNTVSFYMRNLRAMQNKAIEREIIDPSAKSPFKDVFTGVAETGKRALSKTEIGSLFLLFGCGILKGKQKDALALYLFCFCAQGMSFVDAVFLRKSDVKDGEIVYRRRKTGREVRVILDGKAKQIIEWFSESVADSPFVFPFINPKAGDEYRQYLSAISKQNRLLKQIGRMAGIRKPFAHHSARHSYATQARDAKTPLSLICEALGHRDEKTTRIYLDRLDSSLLAKVNAKVMCKFTLDTKQKRRVRA